MDHGTWRQTAGKARKLGPTGKREMPRKFVVQQRITSKYVLPQQRKFVIRFGHIGVPGKARGEIVAHIQITEYSALIVESQRGKACGLHAKISIHVSMIGIEVSAGSKSQASSRARFRNQVGPIFVFQLPRQ